MFGHLKTVEVRDFIESKYTAVVSDLHLCEAEPNHPKFPLWKKYKTRQHFFDKAFSEFLIHIQKKARGEKVELVFNGDIFDFDSVCALPPAPPYRLSWLERRRGMHPQEQKSQFKIQRILEHHAEWVAALRAFLLQGHRAIFVIGNHDLELHWPDAKRALMDSLDLPASLRGNVRFCEWFYISNKDTLIEHGNQYDPYCVAQNPVSPFILRFNRLEIRIPFGNLATRYMINGMGFFNPHADTNFIMTPKEYVRFFFKYMFRAQPLLLVTWLWSSSIILVQSFFDRLRPDLCDPLSIEDRYNWIAQKANATPRMVRELKELFVPPAASYPLLLARELWLDRAFLVVLAFFVFFQIVLYVRLIYQVSFFWMFIPLFLFLPFFLFYSRSVVSEVIEYKEPREKVLTMASLITGCKRVVYGHTHIPRHEIIGSVEHLNSGTWSPAFEDVECKIPVDQKTFVWIGPGPGGNRIARTLQFRGDGESEINLTSTRVRKKSA